MDAPALALSARMKLLVWMKWPKMRFFESKPLSINQRNLLCCSYCVSGGSR